MKVLVNLLLRYLPVWPESPNLSGEGKIAVGICGRP